MAEFGLLWKLSDGPGTVGVRLTEKGQEIGFQQVGWSGLLGLALGGDRERRVETVEGEEFLILEHDDDLDRRIYETIDLLISIRYAHPTMMQLELVLPEEHAQELQAILDAPAEEEAAGLVAAVEMRDALGG